MAYYNKGANAERDLVHKLFDEGLAVVRVAGSGATSLPCPDLVALAPNLKLGFECKAWNRQHLSVSLAQMAELEQWCKRAGADFFVAWKIPHKGWFFIPPEMFKRTKSGYSISQRKALVQNVKLEVILGRQNRLGFKGKEKKESSRTNPTKSVGEGK